MTTPAVPKALGRANYLKRINSKAAKRAGPALWEDGHRSCAYCSSAILFPIEAKMYRPPANSEPHAPEYSTFTLSDGTIAVIGHKVCPLPKR